MITEFMEPITKIGAQMTGIPVDDYTAQQGGEFWGFGTEQIYGITTKGVLNRGLNLLTGLIAGLMATDKSKPERLRRELVAWAEHNGLRSVNLSVPELMELKTSLTNTISGIQAGNWSQVYNANVRSMSELQAIIQATFGFPIPRSAPPPAPPSSSNVKNSSQTVSSSSIPISRVSTQKANGIDQSTYQITAPV